MKLMPEAASFTRACPGPGSEISTSSKLKTSGPPNSCIRIAFMLLSFPAVQLFVFARRRMCDSQQIGTLTDRLDPPRVLHRARVLDRDLFPRCRHQVLWLEQPRSALVQVDSFGPWFWVRWPWGHSLRPPASGPPGDPRAGRAAPTRKRLPKRRPLMGDSKWQTRTSLRRRKVVVQC